MQRAALYARVSTDAQKQEGTIESQIAELRRQIAAVSHVLVKEYIDDGYTGSRMDRPALQELRANFANGVRKAAPEHGRENFSRVPHRPGNHRRRPQARAFACYPRGADATSDKCHRGGSFAFGT